MFVRLSRDANVLVIVGIDERILNPREYSKSKINYDSFKTRIRNRRPHDFHILYRDWSNENISKMEVMMTESWVLLLDTVEIVDYLSHDRFDSGESGSHNHPISQLLTFHVFGIENILIVTGFVQVHLGNPKTFQFFRDSKFHLWIHFLEGFFKSRQRKIVGLFTQRRCSDFFVDDILLTPIIDTSTVHFTVLTFTDFHSTFGHGSILLFQPEMRRGGTSLLTPEEFPDLSVHITITIHIFGVFLYTPSIDPL